MFFPVLQLLSFQFCKCAVCEVNFGITVLIIVNKLQFSLLSVRMLREELQLLQEQGSYVGEVVKPMDKKKVLVKVHPEGKFVVDLDKNIDINDVTANSRVALRNESYTLHKILPNKVCTITYKSRDISVYLFLSCFHIFTSVSDYCRWILWYRS